MRIAQRPLLGRPPPASTMESEVERTLLSLLKEGPPLDDARVRELTTPTKPEIAEIRAPGIPDLAVYDQLLSGSAR